MAKQDQQLNKNPYAQMRRLTTTQVCTFASVNIYTPRVRVRMRAYCQVGRDKASHAQK